QDGHFRIARAHVVLHQAAKNQSVPARDHYLGFDPADIVFVSLVETRAVAGRNLASDGIEDARHFRHDAEIDVIVGADARSNIENNAEVGVSDLGTTGHLHSSWSNVDDG